MYLNASMNNNNNNNNKGQPISAPGEYNMFNPRNIRHIYTICAK